MALRRDIEVWGRIVISLAVLGMGCYFVGWGPTAEARGQGGVMIGGVMAYWFMNRRNGNGGYGNNGKGHGESGGEKWRNLTLRAVQVSLVAGSGLLGGWWQLLQQGATLQPIACALGLCCGGLLVMAGKPQPRRRVRRAQERAR